MTSSPRAWSLDRWLLTLLLCAPVLGLIGVVAAEIVPDGRIGYHLIAAEHEGIAGSVERDPSMLGTTTDHYSECVAITVGLGDLPGENLFTRAMRSPAYYGCKQMVDKLKVLETTGALAPGWPYLRYWHGYAVVTRPAIAILGLAGARWVGFGLLVVAVAGMAARVKRSFGVGPTLFLLAPALLTTDMVVDGLTLSQAVGLATAWVGGWMALAVVARRPNWRTAALAAALAGAVNAYFDLMTTIPGAMALTAVGATLGVYTAGTERARRDAWQVSAAAVVAWTVGLSFMWSMKWVFAALVLGVDDVVDNVKHQIEFRLSGDYEGVSPTRTRGLTDNLGEWWHQPLTPWLVVAMLAGLVALGVRARSNARRWTSLAACVAVIAVPTAGWYLVLNNHTQIHFWLVYRSIPIAFGGLSALIAAGMTARRDNAASELAADHADDTPVTLMV